MTPTLADGVWRRVSDEALELAVMPRVDMGQDESAHPRARRDLSRLRGRGVGTEAQRAPLGEGRLVYERVRVAGERLDGAAGLGVGGVDHGRPRGRRLEAHGKIGHAPVRVGGGRDGEAVSEIEAK